MFAKSGMRGFVALALRRGGMLEEAARRDYRGRSAEQISPVACLWPIDHCRPGYSCG
jgi:hypothetical protein